jgi:ribonuclease P protein component
MRRLTQRSQFLKAARGAKASRRAFVLQMVEVPDASAGLGYTVTARTGNSVERNRIRRRLRAAARANARQFAAGRDYVLIGRRDALHEPFDKLVGGLAAALGEIGSKGEVRDRA